MLNQRLSPKRRFVEGAQLPAVQAGAFAAQLFAGFDADAHMFVDRAFVELAEDNGSLYVAEWERLTQHQQNVLRAAAAGDAGLTTKRSRDRFALGESGTATNAARALVGTGILLKTPESPTGYTFDNPFFREWVRRHTIEDLGA